MKTVKLDPYVLDTLMPDLVGHDRHPSSFIVYLFLSRHARGTAVTAWSLRAIADGTGLSKRAVQVAVARLKKRRLLEVRRESLTAVPSYRVLRPWRRKRVRATG